MKTNRPSTAPFRAGSARPANKGKPSQSVEVNSLLRNQLAHLWPTISNNAALQKECATALPQLFLYCQVLQLEAEQLVLAAPNAALASKLKQQLPKLQTALQKAGWQINAIRIKVQVTLALHNEPAEKQCLFSDSALKAFDSLEKNLAGSKHNDELLGALRTLLNRHKK
ncbi:DciA family protein [Solimicrobium silvestre]|nr:DciA family protein [Solimicrobium silvestre]